MAILETIFIGLAWLIVSIGIIAIVYSIVMFLFIIGYYSLLLLPIIIFAYVVGWIAQRLGLNCNIYNN